VLFINAINEVTRKRTHSFLTDEHIERVVAAWHTFADEDGFARVATPESLFQGVQCSGNAAPEPGD